MNIETIVSSGKQNRHDAFIDMIVRFLFASHFSTK